MSYLITHQLACGGSFSTNDPHIASTLIDAEKTLNNQRAEDVRAMKALGVDAAHPDDGWHKRDTHEVHLCYPFFEGRIKVGSRIALHASHAINAEPGTVKIVTVTEVKRGIMPNHERYAYDPATVEEIDLASLRCEKV